MILEVGIAMGISLLILTFLCEYMDSTLGMGYGTTLTPLLLLLGFEPIQIVPSILMSQFVAGIFAGSLHHRFKNVDFSRGGRSIKIAMLLALCGIVGMLLAVSLTVGLPQFYLKLYIGFLVMSIGIIILLSRDKHYKFSWKKIMALGLVASFNKGLSGGGYGPIIAGGQILSGVNEKNAIGITALSEGLTCIVGLIMYTLIQTKIDWILAPYLIVGAILSVPLSTFTVKKIRVEKVRMMIGLATLILGAVIIIKLFW